jgi:hypothetical protein
LNDKEEKPTRNDYEESQEEFRAQLLALRPKVPWLLGVAHENYSGRIVRETLKLEPIESAHPYRPYLSENHINSLAADWLRVQARLRA